VVSETNSHASILGLQDRTEAPTKENRFSAPVIKSCFAKIKEFVHDLGESHNIRTYVSDKGARLQPGRFRFRDPMR
jgi:hypothetical protein